MLIRAVEKGGQRVWMFIRPLALFKLLNALLASTSRRASVLSLLKILLAECTAASIPAIWPPQSWCVRQRKFEHNWNPLYWPCNSLDTYWLLCTTADGQLTSRSRLEPLHIVSQGMVPLTSGHPSSSLSFIYGLDICNQHGWLNRSTWTDSTCGLLCASTHPDIDTTYK